VSPADEIRNLLGRYCDAMDGGDFAAVGALFERGRRADEHGTALAEGAAAVERFYAAGTRLHDGSPRTKHLVTNTVVDLAADDRRAIARSSYLVLQQVPGGPLQPIITGRYEDHLSADDGWHFVERRFFVDLMGDLSQHLRYEVP
jgi:hypothetical protein